MLEQAKEFLDDLRAVLKENRKDEQREAVEGIKYFRMPTLYASPANGTVALGTAPPLVGPNSGYCWSIRRLAVNGLGTGANPDILNIYRNGTVGNPIWQLNGNNWGYSFGPTEMLLLPGESLQAVSLGSMTATGQIFLSGDVIEVPQQMIGRLVV